MKNDSDNPLIPLASNPVQRALARAWVGPRYWKGLSKTNVAFVPTSDDACEVSEPSQIFSWKYLREAHSWRKPTSVLLWGSPSEDVAIEAAAELLSIAVLDGLKIASVTSNVEWWGSDAQRADVILLRGLGSEGDLLAPVRRWYHSCDAKTLILTGSGPAPGTKGSDGQFIPGDGPQAWLTRALRLQTDYVFHLKGIASRVGRRART